MLRLAFRLLILLFLALPGYAKSESFYIKDYHSDIYINKNGVVDVVETIKVYFTTKRHGIIRIIPYRYKVDNSLSGRGAFGRVYKISIFNIKVDGFEYSVRKADGNVRIRIGSPDRYVKGDVVYKIRFSMFGVINRFSKHDEFYYNVIGTKWPVRILRSSFNLNLPTELSKDKIKYRVFSGPFGSKHQEPATYFGGTVSCYVDHPLAPHNGLTVVVAFPKGYIGSGGLWLRLKLFMLNNSIFALPFFVFIALFGLWYVVGRDRKRPIAVYYKPPEDMTPAEAGMLIDDTIDNDDLIALIFYWASKGYIEIEEVENKKALFRKRDLLLRKLKDLPETAKEFEKIIFYGLFDNRDVVRVSSLRNGFYQTMNDAKSSLDSYIKELRLYEKGTRKLGLILKMVAMGFFGLSFVFFIQFEMKYFTAFVLTGVIFFVFGKIMPKKSSKGTDRYFAIRGFKEFMERAEKDRLKRLLDEDPDYFYNTLSFAIAFGELKKWARKFDDLVSQPPNWYRTDRHGAFSAYTFATMMDRDITMMGQTFTSQPSSSGSSAASGSSGFGGGGFSGGGFGGGGGSSW
ncbi:DUF2207 domain-containing protein [Hippea sp. KM1]|uniref:DUF2207 domain-containing protein n=1 Tax=Hippea sp. KM1 TaxID=944481 RepID=UPI00046C990E|nr:DUF2207 domain-containing protein [Hippea sp. KM1]